MQLQGRLDEVEAELHSWRTFEVDSWWAPYTPDWAAWNSSLRSSGIRRGARQLGGISLLRRGTHPNDELELSLIHI
eukprot:2342617-Prorocentrum_lima.AAC.1